MSENEKKKKKLRKIIAVANQKGGCGKTTIATNLAVLFASEAYDVLLIDADPEQLSSMDWCSDRSEVGNIPFIQSQALPAKNLRQNASQLRDKYEIIIVDGGARIADHAHAAVAVADFVIVPIKSSSNDVKSTRKFLEVVADDMDRHSDLKVGLLFNDVNINTILAQETLKQIKEWTSFEVFDTTLGHYVAFEEAVSTGTGVTEHAPKDKAAIQFRAFYEELKEAL